MSGKELLHKIGYLKIIGRSAASGLNTWPIVAFGFGTILLLGAAVTVMTLGSITEMRRSVLTLTDTYHNRREHIEGLRSQIYVSSILIRDYLLDRKPGVEVNYRNRLRENHAAALEQLEALSRYSALSPSEPQAYRSFATRKSVGTKLDILSGRQSSMISSRSSS